MSRLLFHLNNVPDDEAADVRALLAEHHIDYYETEAGRWGISLAAIWLKEEGRFAEARGLIEEYQRAREARARGEYEALRNEGRHETLGHRFRQAPLRFLFYSAAIAAILSLTLLPFLRQW
jgi:hypothetical protein